LYLLSASIKSNRPAPLVRTNPGPGELPKAA
jgi:hypothetical protein